MRKSTGRTSILWAPQFWLWYCCSKFLAWKFELTEGPPLGLAYSGLASTCSLFATPRFLSNTAHWRIWRQAIWRRRRQLWSTDFQVAVNRKTSKVFCQRKTSRNHNSWNMLLTPVSNTQFLQSHSFILVLIEEDTKFKVNWDLWSQNFWMFPHSFGAMVVAQRYLSFGFWYPFVSFPPSCI